MNYRETYTAITSGNNEQRAQALLELTGTIRVLAEAVLEIAGEQKLRTSIDPLTYRSNFSNVAS
jgi:hypothetical protein